MNIRMKSTHRRKTRARRRMIQNRFSVILVSCVIVIFAGVLSVGSMSLHAKWQEQEAQIEALNKQLAADKERAEEIDELGDYIGSDEYIEEVARENGLVYPNEIIFKPVP